jgi:hypothetical protein
VEDIIAIIAIKYINQRVGKKKKKKKERKKKKKKK